MIKYVRLGQKNQKLLAILDHPDKIVWENLESDFKIKNHRLPIFSLAEALRTNIIDELIIRLKHKVNLPMVLFPEIHPRFLKGCHFVSFPDIRKKSDYLIGYQVKAAPILNEPNLK
jgi:putative glycerol-1-phosphate prenyltransferase